MRRNLFGGFAAIAMSTLLFSGCAKDQVKPDEGIATQQPPQTSQSASQQAADQLAAERRKLAEEQEAARQAALKAEQLKDQLVKYDESAGQKSTPGISVDQSAETAKSALARIHFDYDSYALSQSSRDTLYNSAEYLLKKYKGKVRLEGHCDERGSDEYNLALGENRAKAAMNYLLTLGVPAEQLSIVSYGKERPLVNGHDEESWARNRRVEFDIVK